MQWANAHPSCTSARRQHVETEVGADAVVGEAGEIGSIAGRGETGEIGSVFGRNEAGEIGSFLTATSPVVTIGPVRRAHIGGARPRAWHARGEAQVCGAAADTSSGRCGV